MGEPRDRDAILARRAALIASALSSFTLTTRAQAQAEPPSPKADAPAVVEGPCSSGEPPTEIAKTEARLRFELAATRMKEGQFEEASREAHAAWERVPHEKIALLAIDADLARSAFAEAFALGELHVRCFGASPALDERIEKARAATSHVRFAWESMGDVVIELDGRQLGAEELSRGLRVSPGEHRVVLRFQDRTSMSAFTSVAGEDQTVTMGPLGPPPMPCLQPPFDHRDPETVLHFRGAVMAPMVAFHVPEPAEITAGSGFFEELAGQATPDLWLEVNLFQCMTFTEDVAYGWIGGGAEVQYRFAGPFAFGAGFAGGGLLTPEHSERANAFFGPVLIPVSIVEGLFFLEARLPIWLTPVVGFEPKLEFGGFAPQLAIGLGGPVLREYDDTPQ